MHETNISSRSQGWRGDFASGKKFVRTIAAMPRNRQEPSQYMGRLWRNADVLPLEKHPVTSQ
ncbi:MAG: hypothetical protein CME86_01195 [Herbaspirillum sp.]|nr:hypothetical protein [Herbaspirillum sp.]MBO18462.1 hypothetical protein [Herbaspirillum sp.]